MTCQTKRSYLISLLDTETLEEGFTVVQTSCTHDIQEFLQGCAQHGGGLLVSRSLDPDAGQFTMFHPLVTDIDAETAKHLPINDPVS